MAYSIERATGDIVIGGFSQGVQSSPHKGIANLQNANISTEDGEVMTSYARYQQSQVTESGTLTRFSTSSLTVSGTTNPLRAGTWISVSGNTISGLSNGTYYVISKGGTSADSSIVQLSTTYSTSSGDIISGLGTGTASFSTLFAMATAVQAATEPYHDTSGTQQYRYYILDTNGRIWVHDTQTYSGLDSPLWALPSTNGMSSYGGGVPGGLAVLNGWLIITGGSFIYTKSTSQLASDPSNSFLGVAEQQTMSTATTTNPQFAFTGHQGKTYYTDGNYIGSIFPDTSLLTAVNNVQSYCSYTASTSTGTITAIIGGSLPYTFQADGVTIQRIPVVFFPTSTGAQPTNLTAGQIYWLEFSLGLSPADTFKVYDIQTGNDTVTATGTISMGATSANLTAAWPYASGIYETSFTSGDTKNVTYTYGSVSTSWTGGLTTAADPTMTLTLAGGIPINIAAGATGTQYFNTFFPQSTSAAQTITFSRQRVNLPFFEVATTLGEIGNTIIIGTRSNSLYPWNQIDALPSSLISLPEANTQQILTVNQMAYIFPGNKGNVYITDGSVASLVIKVPDYCAGVPGTPPSYIEPTFTWGGTMYLRGRVYFSVLDQTSTKAGNCGGIWSFIPTQNLYIGQDTGLALRQENVNSYGTYSGVATVLLANQTQTGISPQFWSAWYSSISGPTYGIDYTNTYPGRPPYGSATGTNFNTVIETDLIPIGTMLKKYTPTQIEYKLATPLASGENVSIYYRLNGTDAWTSLGTAFVESDTDFAGYFTTDFQNAQWLQLQAVLIPTDYGNSGIQSSFVRTSEFRIRNQA